MASVTAFMDRIMSGARGRARAPRVLAEERLTPEQLRDVGSKVALRALRGKGLGLVARRALKAHERVGVYAGKVFSAAEHARLTREGATTGKYAVDHFRTGADGRTRSDYIMDPGAGAGNAMHPDHANVLAAFINEPAQGQVPNCVWVRNHASGRMELWTARAVPKGAELTACYGTGYPRDYATPCTRVPGALHQLLPGQRVPTQV